MRFNERPQFVPPEVIGSPIDFAWEGARDHIGPTEKVTPLLDQLAGTTTCAQVSMCAGVLLWGAWRFSGLAPVEHDFELAEAAFAWQVDWRYADPDRGPKGKPPDQPPAVSATMKLDSLMRSAMDVDQYWNSYYQPVRETFHSAHIVQHVLPKPARKVFQGWLKSLTTRVKEIAPKPDEEFRKKKDFASIEEHQAFIARHRGLPLPPDILLEGHEVTAERSRALVQKFITGLDWKANRYLRPPDEMRALGFEGQAYGG